MISSASSPSDIVGAPRGDGCSPGDPVVWVVMRGLDYADRIVAGVPSGRGDAPTPCPDLDVAALLDHLIRQVTAFGSVCAHEPGDPERVPGPAELGPVDAYRSAADRVREVWTPRRLSETFPLPHGRLTGMGLSRFFLLELLGHGWDLAVATRLDADADPVLACAGLGAADAVGELLRRAGRMAPPVIVPPDASLMDRFAAAIGRDPAAWTSG